MKHVIKITEHLVRYVIAEADSVEEAKDKARKAYQNGEFEFDYDSVDSDIEYVGEPDKFAKAFYEEI